ncbi:MAG: response regulator [Acidobacteriota bacterium]
MSQTCLRFLFALAVALWAAAAWAQSNSNPLVRAFPRQAFDGTIGVVFDAAQDERGLLYFAAASPGLLEFDGERWRVVYSDPFLQGLDIDDRGRIWMSGPGRIGYFAVDAEGRRWNDLISLLPEEQRSFSDTWPVLATDDGVFFASREFLFRYRDDPEPHFRAWPGSSDEIFYRLYDLDGRFFVAQLGVGLLELTADDRLVHLGDDELAEAEINAAFSLGDDRFLLMTRLRGAFVLEGRSLSPVDGPAVGWLNAEQIQHGCLLPDGRFALATRRGGIGIVDRELNLHQIIDEKSGLTSSSINVVFVDRRNNLWATSDKGVDRIVLETTTERFGRATGLPEVTVNQVEMHQDALYVANVEGLYQGQYVEGPAGPDVEFDPAPLLESQVWQLLSLDEVLLVATTDGLFELRIRQSGGVSLSSGAKLNSNATLALLAYPLDTDLPAPPESPGADGQDPGSEGASADHVIVGMAGGLGLARRDGETWKFSKRLPGLQQDVWALAMGDDGEIIAATPGDARLAALRFKDGFEAEPEILYFDTSETSSTPMALGDGLYLAGDGSFLRYRGLGAMREGRGFEADSDLSVLAELGAETILYEDGRARLWVNTPRGLRLASRLASGGFELGAVSSLVIESSTLVFEDPRLPEIFWVGTIDGLMRLAPGEQPSQRPAPTTLVRRVTAISTSRDIDDGTVKLTQSPVLEWEENALRFEFAAPVFEQSLDMLYRVRLDGYDSVWTDFSDESFKEYTSLDEGSYSFRVQAQDALGNFGPVATWSFRILPPWYRTGWAFLSYFLGTVGLMLLFVTGRTRRLERRRRALEGLVEARTTELAGEKNQVERQAKDLERVNVLLAEENEHRRHLEAERAKLQERNERSEKLESLGLMAGGIAHDFNNILMAILGNADLSLEEEGLSDPVERRLRAISDAGRRAAELCQQMLAYAGKGHFEEREISLSTLAGETLDILRVSIADDIEVIIELDPKVPAVLGDPSKISQLVLNLLSNAAEAIGSRGELRLVTGLRHLTAEDNERLVLAEPITEGPYVFVRVQDDGEGMDEETRRRLFDPFFTTKFAGRGLGMAAALGILRSHGGAISVESTPGEGTVVEAYFPALDHAAGETTPQTPEFVRRWSPTGTILVVDDEAVVRDVVELILRNTGFKVLTASGGQRAIEIFEAQHASIAGVVMDLTMPGMDGLATFERMREISPDVRVLLSSGYSGDTLIERYLDKGFAGFVAKPYRPATLRAALRNALNS